MARASLSKCTVWVMPSAWKHDHVYTLTDRYYVFICIAPQDTRAHQVCSMCHLTTIAYMTWIGLCWANQKQSAATECNWFVCCITWFKVFIQSVGCTRLWACLLWHDNINRVMLLTSGCIELFSESISCGQPWAHVLAPTLMQCYNCYAMGLGPWSSGCIICSIHKKNMHLKRYWI